MIEEIRADKEFLREDLREARAGRQDVTAIAQRMLETLESIAIGGKLLRHSTSSDASHDIPPITPSDREADGNQSPTFVPHQEATNFQSGDNGASQTDAFRI